MPKKEDQNYMLLAIKNNIYYQSDFDSPLIQGIDDPETPRPWNLINEIKQVISREKTLLDIGCGTGSKIFPLSAHLLGLVGLDPSQSMLDSALQKKSAFSTTIELVKGRAEYLPFQNQSFDIITSILSRWDVKEISRVLKLKGTAFIETIGCQDKRNFKYFFGTDELGWRGQFMEYDQEEYVAQCQEKFSQFFHTVSVRNGFWNTYYSPEGIKKLLSFTPTIRNYDEACDAQHLEKAIQACSTEKGIKLTQNRIFIYAKNPRDL